MQAKELILKAGMQQIDQRAELFEAKATDALNAVLAPPNTSERYKDDSATVLLPILLEALQNMDSRIRAYLLLVYGGISISIILIILTILWLI